DRPHRNHGPARKRGRLLRCVRQFPDQLFVLAFPNALHFAPDGHCQHSRGEREHSLAMELSARQRSVRHLYGWSAFRQPSRGKSAAVLREPLRHQVHILLASVRVSMKWITRKNVKVDRVACPWLIK